MKRFSLTDIFAIGALALVVLLLVFRTARADEKPLPEIKPTVMAVIMWVKDDAIVSYQIGAAASMPWCQATIAQGLASDEAKQLIESGAHPFVTCLDIHTKNTTEIPYPSHK